jgi:hypothetical protein
VIILAGACVTPRLWATLQTPCSVKPSRTIGHDHMFCMQAKPLAPAHSGDAEPRVVQADKRLDDTADEGASDGTIFEDWSGCQAARSARYRPSEISLLATSIQGGVNVITLLIPWSGLEKMVGKLVRASGVESKRRCAFSATPFASGHGGYPRAAHVTARADMK